MMLAMDDPRAVTAEYSVEEREEIGKIDYLLDELRRLSEQGMVPPETVERVAAEKAMRRGEIERGAVASGALKAARLAFVARPRDALAYAEKARALTPEKVDCWSLSADLLGSLVEFDRSIAVCREGADQYGHALLRGRIAGFEGERNRRERAAAIEDAAARARRAANQGDHEASLAAGQEVLAHDPAHAEALAMAVSSLAALGRLDEALVRCAGLRRVRPSEAAGWAERIRVLREREAAPAPGQPEGPERVDKGESERLARARPAQPRPSPPLRR